MSHDVEAALIEAVNLRPSMSVGELVEVVSESLDVGRHEVARSLYISSKEGRLRFEDPKPPNSLLGYARSTYSLWFWSLLTIVALSAATIYLFPQATPNIYLRNIVGSLFILYLPGYSLIETLYPKKEDVVPLERIVLSIGLSLAMVPLVGLVLNYTPWGIRLDPIVASLGVLTVALAWVAVVRKFTYFRMEVETMTSPRPMRRRVEPRRGAN